MGTVSPKSLKKKKQDSYTFKNPPECKGCVCLECDFKGECHCMLKDMSNKIDKDGIMNCDNYMEVK